MALVLIGSVRAQMDGFQRTRSTPFNARLERVPMLCAAAVYNAQAPTLKTTLSASCLGLMAESSRWIEHGFGHATDCGYMKKIGLEAKPTKNALKLPGVTCATTPFNCNAENGYNQVPNFSDKPCPNGVCTNPVCCISMFFKATLLLLALTVRLFLPFLRTCIGTLLSRSVVGLFVASSVWRCVCGGIFTPRKNV